MPPLLTTPCLTRLPSTCPLWQVRLRTTFYGTLCKLLFLDEANLKFKAFVEPLTRLLRDLLRQSDEAFGTPAVRQALIGVLRDLRGIVAACSNRRTYSLFFDWLYPEFTPLLLRAVVRDHDTPPHPTRPPPDALW